jgi:dUTP pyrophosphatase
MKIKFKALTSEAVLPHRGTTGSAGLDLFTLDNVTFRKGEITWVSTGWAIEIPDGHFGLLKPRSGLASKHGLMLATSGVIDSDYRGEIRIPMILTVSDQLNVFRQSRVAQLIILPYLDCVPTISDALTVTGRGTGGFGSTGENKAN